MDAELYNQFLALKDVGKAAEAKILLEAFIASFQNRAESGSWVFTFLEGGQYGHVIRREIYEKLVYPTLLDGYLKGDARSVTWLAKTTLNLSKLKSVHPSLHEKSEFTLLKEAYSLNPTTEVREGLLKSLLSFFEYTMHEWPSGILFGTDGANRHECDQILQEVEFVRGLDFGAQHSIFYRFSKPECLNILIDYQLEDHQKDKSLDLETRCTGTNTKTARFPKKARRFHSLFSTVQRLATNRGSSNR